MLYDGAHAETLATLQRLRAVTAHALHPPLANPALADHAAAYLQGVQEQLHRPLRGNAKLVLTQQYAMACGVTWAAQDGLHWLLHIDVDELLHVRDGRGVGGVLGGVPHSVPSVRAINVEAQAQAIDITQPFVQVRVRA